MKSGRENQCQVILQPLLLQLIPGMLTRGRKKKEEKNPRLLFAELTPITVLVTGTTGIESLSLVSLLGLPHQSHWMNRTFQSFILQLTGQ